MSPLIALMKDQVQNLRKTSNRFKLLFPLFLLLALTLPLLAVL